MAIHGLYKVCVAIYTQSLYFAKVELLEDDFEGLYPKSNLEHISAQFEHLVPDSQDRELALDAIVKAFRGFTAINSWHINQYESAAMWKLYLKSGEGIAVQSTFSMLAESFDDSSESIHIGKVNYIDYETDTIPFPRQPSPGAFLPFLYKRKSFEHENELRVAVNIPKLTEGIKGLYVAVNLDILIEKIFVSPSAPKWFTDLVKSVLSKYSLPTKPVEQSSLSSRQLYKI